MKSTNAYHIQVIREALSRRQRANRHYSLRAFARDITLEPSTLSQVLKGARPLPIKKCGEVATRLRLSPLERERFMESAIRKRALLDQLATSERFAQDRFIIDESHHRVIAEWEHYAVLTLLDIDGYSLPSAGATAVLARKFGITPLRAEAVLQNLCNAGLIQEIDHSFVKMHASVHTTDQVASTAIRESHLETMDLGKEKLAAIPLELRDFTSIQFAFDPDQMAELSAIIREFRQKVGALARAGKRPREVYQLAIQAYPLSQILLAEEKKNTRTHKQEKSQ